MEDFRPLPEQLTGGDARSTGGLVRRSLPLIAAALLGLVLAFGGASAVTGAQAGSRSTERPTATATESPYPVNANGETFGSGFGAWDGGPDLIVAYGDDGELGYVRAEDLEDPQPSSVDEALELNKIGPRVINLYAEDGTTIIGRFTVGPPHGSILEPGEGSSDAESRSH